MAVVMLAMDATEGYSMTNSSYGCYKEVPQDKQELLTMLRVCNYHPENFTPSYPQEKVGFEWHSKRMWDTIN